MENRRPPRSNSFGRKPFDRGRGPTKPRGGNRKPRGDGADADAGNRGYRGQGKSYNWQPDKQRRRPMPPGRRGLERGKQPDTEPLIEITSDAQITDGKFRGRFLKNSVSPGSNHTGSKLRKILFKTLARRVKAARVLDLGAGCGTIGFEAISRGAMLVTFVDRSARSCSYLRKNIAEFGIKNGHAEVIEMEVLPYVLKSSRRKRMWDIVYVDVPAGSEQMAVFEHLSRGSCVRQRGLVLIQHDSETAYPETQSLLRRRRFIEQDKTILTVYERI